MLLIKACPTCGTSFNSEGVKKYCSQRCGWNRGRTPEATAARFWAKVEKGDGCWIWKAARSVSKYGTFNLHGHNINAHRAAWIITYGPIEGKGVDVLHRCANGIGGCVRPDHLYLGTDKENAKDRVVQGGSSKLGSVQQVIQIKRILSQRPMLVRGDLTRIAREVGVEPRVVSAIKTEKNWRHINPDSTT